MSGAAPQKRTLQEHFAQHTDKAQYDAVIFVGLTGVNVSNLGIAGALPQGTDPKKYIFSKLQEASFGLAFSGDK